MVSIKNVAESAGVSVATVSKVFNGYTDVSEKTRVKVFEAAKQLNYSPNIVAKSLSQKQSRTIALLLSNFSEANSQDGVTFKIMSGVIQETANCQYELVVFTASQTHQLEKSYYQFCRERNVSGVIIHGLKTSDRYYKEILNSEIPCVVIDTQTIGKNTSSISIDNVQAAKEAVQFLISSGHKNIATISGSPSAVVSVERLEGYKLALKEAGIPYNDDFVATGNFSEIQSYFLTEDLLKNNPSITAIFCASDLMAIGAMKKCQEIGKNVPKDISIMGFDDIDLSRYVTPSISTVRQDFQLMGTESVKLLMENIEKNISGIHKNLPHKMVDRSTVLNIQ